jgi:hypothetical protein
MIKSLYNLNWVLGITVPKPYFKVIMAQQVLRSLNEDKSNLLNERLSAITVITVWILLSSRSASASIVTTRFESG